MSLLSFSRLPGVVCFAPPNFAIPLSDAGRQRVAVNSDRITDLPDGTI
jgi:hypothetical protein